MTEASTVWETGIINRASAVRRRRLGSRLVNSRKLTVGIAHALSVSPDEVRVDCFRRSPSGLSALCAGRWNKLGFFGKTLLADPYPVPARFQPPWEETHNPVQILKPAAEQIQTEWEMSLRMRAFSEGNCVPLPLGKSLAASTLVWEEAPGIRLDKAIRLSRWKVSMSEMGARALYQAGKWLRFVQHSSQKGSKATNVRELVMKAILPLGSGEPEIAHYELVAKKVLESCIREMGGVEILEVPVTFAHGDFCLPNLLWDDSCRQLHVIDFELSGFRPMFYDLFALISDLHAQLLNPLVPKQVVLAWEDSFWRGYGPIPERMLTFVRALATARIFYHNFCRLLTRKQRRGRLAGCSARLYRKFLQRAIITHRLDLPWAAQSLK